MLSLCVMNPKERNSPDSSAHVPKSSSGTGPDGHEDKNSTSGDARRHPRRSYEDRCSQTGICRTDRGAGHRRIDAYEAQVDEYYANKGDEEECGCGCSHDEGSCEDSDDDVIPSDDPIVLEVERLIAAYSDRFDELCKENGEVPEEALTYKPRTPIEQVAFDIFTDALHDSLMDEDDE